MMIESVLTRQGAATGLHLPFGDKPFPLYLSKLYRAFQAQIPPPPGSQPDHSSPIDLAII